tara:strand:+ start:18873 stop:19703 length:831 start_codon:yes stop_codon:yes gene_type:complete
MKKLQDTPFEAYFLEGSKGRLFGLYIPALGTPRGQLLCIPPFAEESNRSRAMLGMAARALAHQGFGTLILDLYGTGDSDGDFDQADWSVWLDDIGTGIQWLQQKKGQLTLWGTRLAALLVTDAAARQPDAITRLLYWQPVSNGKTLFTQYLRLRVANSLENSGTQETTKTLRERLANGETLEIGGYYISPAMAAGLDAAVMPEASSLAGIRIDWLEVVGEGKHELPPGSKKFVDGWQAQQLNVHSHPFSGPPFWQLYERFIAPDLVSKTLQVMNDE